ncbi:DUF3987 domain-containing protein [Burkholderia sp. GbtcB21]|uniref:DUF3987 domain-containing protein n=1 Tax=Burkholderia sp. GbtcB21 TaxID=2824766 RepID=UPI001C2FC24B|nr:DUF3987 domain-containing protein [Burkholderia sp. GbtcB21]
MANNACLETALAALSMGLCAIPAAGHMAPSNPKKPFGLWRKYQHQHPSSSHIEHLYATNQFTTVGLVCGKISGGLECLDFDTLSGYQLFRQAAKTSEVSPLVARIEVGYAEMSPKGAHLLYFCESAGRNQMLNEHLKIETRGEGGFVVIAPTTFAGDDGCKRYQLQSGALASIVRISPAEREELHAFIRALVALQPPAINAVAVSQATGMIAEGGRNNALTSLAGKLHHGGASAEALSAALHAENKARCVPPLPASEVEAIIRSVSRYRPGRALAVSSPIILRAPLDLPTGMPVVPPLDTRRLLPRGLSDWVSDTAHRLQCPPDYPAVGLLVALSAVIGGRLSIRPKQRDNWTVTPNLWGLIIGRPGSLKSPAMAAALAPLYALDREALAKHEAALLSFRAQKTAYDLAIGQVKTKAKGNSAALQQISATANSMTSIMQQEPVLPKRTRYVVNDVTVEKLGEILAENPNGVLLFRDELKGFLAELEGEENANKRGFVLQAWTGDSSYNFDRIGRGSVRIERAILSVLGTTQPGVVEAHLASAMRGGVGDDGLVQRFQLAVYPMEPESPELVDEPPDLQAAAFVSALVQRLAQLDPVSLGAQCDNVGANAQWHLRFDVDAQQVFNAWYIKLMRVIKRTEHGAVASHFAKYPSLVPSLALIFHLAEGRSGPVGKEALCLAIGWSSFLRRHAERIYHYSIRSDAHAARALGEAIKAGKLEDGFTLRDVSRKCWTGLTTPSLCRQAIEILADHHWLVVERIESNGKQTERCRINPALIKS